MRTAVSRRTASLACCGCDIPRRQAATPIFPSRRTRSFATAGFCTRDMFMRAADGYFVHQGRSDDLVKIAGQWVQPGEIEEAAARAPEIVEAACIPAADADGLERLALFIAARGEPGAAIEAARRACELHLPRHKRPKWVRTIAQLPRTATGKVQRYKLREILARELAGSD